MKYKSARGCDNKIRCIVKIVQIDCTLDHIEVIIEYDCCLLALFAKFYQHLHDAFL